MEKAKATLDGIDVVGITERMDETMVCYREVGPTIGSRAAELRESAGQSEQEAGECVDTSACRRASGHQARDELYEYALKRFERDIGAVPEG